MHEVFLEEASTRNNITLTVRFYIHFYGILCVDDARDVLRGDGGDNTSLEMDMAERPSMVDRLGQQLDGATGSKLRRMVSGNVKDLDENACDRTCNSRKHMCVLVERVELHEW